MAERVAVSLRHGVVPRETLLALLDLTARTLEHLAAFCRAVAKYCREERVVVHSGSLNPHAELTLWLERDPFDDAVLRLIAYKFDKLGRPVSGVVEVYKPGSIMWRERRDSALLDDVISLARDKAEDRLKGGKPAELTGDPVEDCARLWEWLAEDCLEEARELREKLELWDKV